jgi:transposase
MYGVDFYRRVRLSCHHEGLSQREAARQFGIDRKTVRKILAFSIPPGYRRLPEDNVRRFRNRLRGLRDRYRAGTIGVTP